MFWGTGIVIGFSPIIMMSLLIPGFGIAFWESVRFLFEVKTTNLFLPIPWPWTINFTDTTFDVAIRGVLMGLFFLGTLLFAGLSLTWVTYQRFRNEVIPPALVASAFLAFPYAHHAFSRADLSHLAQGAFPMLIGVFVLLFVSTKKFKWPLALALCMTSLWVMHAHHPGWYCTKMKKCVAVEISGNQIKVRPKIADNISLLRMLVDKYASNGESFIIMPFMPGAYPLFGRRSPLWENYGVWHRNQSFQNKEIEKIKVADPSFVLITNTALDGLEERRFKNNHSFVYNHIVNNFDRVDNYIDGNIELYIKRK